MRFAVSLTTGERAENELGRADPPEAVIQVAGAALIGKAESAKVQGTPFNVTPEQANDILLAGLAIQVRQPPQALSTDQSHIPLHSTRSNTNSSRSTRSKWREPSLIVQTFSFLTFLSVLSVALYRARRPRYMPVVALDSQRKLRITLWVILITSDLILLRTIFRLAETAQGESARWRRLSLVKAGRAVWR
jgi:hypothetical protein